MGRALVSTPNIIKAPESSETGWKDTVIAYPGEVRSYLFQISVLFCLERFSAFGLFLTLRCASGDFHPSQV